MQWVIFYNLKCPIGLLGQVYKHPNTSLGWRAHELWPPCGLQMPSCIIPLVSVQMLVGNITTQRKRLYISLLSKRVYQDYICWLWYTDVNSPKDTWAGSNLHHFLETRVAPYRDPQWWYSMVYAVDKERILINDQPSANAFTHMS